MLLVSLLKIRRFFNKYSLKVKFVRPIFRDISKELHKGQHTVENFLVFLKSRTEKYYILLKQLCLLYCTVHCTLYSRCVIRNIVPQCTKRYFKWGNICFSAQRIMSNIVIFLQCTSSVSSGELFGKHNFTHLFIQYMYSICQETTNSDIIVHWVSVYCTVYLVYLD